MNPQPHSEYRRSDVPFVPELPATWQEKPLKLVAALLLSNVDKHSVDDQPTVLLCNYTDVYYNERITSNLDFMLATASPAQVSRLTLNDGDVVMTKDSEDPTDIGVPAVVVGDIPRLVCGYHLAVVKPASIHGPFLRYVLASKPARAYFYTRARGLTRYGLGKDDLSNIELPMPGLKEQRTIAAFLDYETARIDRLIAKQERLIELLKEKRQAVISHAVTKGLNPDAPMKDSGFEWLGEVPAHWEVVPSTWLFSESKARAKEGDQQLSATQKYGVILQSEFERLEDRQVTHAFMHLDKRKHVDEDNFVVSMRSFEGGIEHVKTEGCVRSSYVVLIAEARADIDFFRHLFKSTAYIQGLQATSNYIRDGQDLNFGNFRQTKLPRPDLGEQREIAAYLDNQLLKIDTLIDKAQQSIPLLGERRSAMISTAVTGKIDLRDWQPTEPEHKETTTA